MRSALTLSRPLSLTGFGVVAMGFAALAGSWALSDRSFEQEIEAALAKQQTNTQTAAKQKTNTPIVGSEDYWLGRTQFSDTNTHPVVAKNGPFKLGDRVSISSNGTKRVLKVISISELNSPAATDKGHDKMLLLVTLQDRSQGSLPGPIIRIVVDADDQTILGTQVSQIEQAL